VVHHSAVTLSIIIPSRDDTPECVETIKSIRATVGDTVEIMVVDDASRQPVPQVMGARVIRCNRRVGVGPARTIGALRASGDYLLFVDSHMRFEPGWYAAAEQRTAGRPNIAHCAQCVGLERGNMDLLRSTSFYHGATFNLYGPDRNRKGANQVLEVVWQPEQPGDDYALPAMMGACYFFPREFFLRLQPLRCLRSYGVDEAMLSLKTWLAGGEIRMLKGVRIGHQFRKRGLPSAAPWHPLYNKLFCMHTCLPPEHAERLERRLPKDGLLGTAKRALYEDWHLVETERAYNRSIFTRDFSWLLDRFQLSFPVT